MCIIVENQEDIAAFKDYSPPEIAAASEPAPAPSVPAPETPSPAATPTPASIPPTPAPAIPAAAPSPPDILPGSRILASPMARTLAARKGIDLSVRVYQIIMYVSIK